MKPKLRSLLAFAFVLVSLVPLLFLGVWVQRTAYENELAAVEEKHLLLARNMTAALERYALDTRVAFPHFMSVDPELRASGNLEQLARQLGFRLFCVIDVQDRVISRFAVPDQVHSPFVRANLARLRAMAKSQPVFSPVMADGEGHPTIFLVQRLGQDQIAIGALSTDYMVKLQEAIAFGRRGQSRRSLGRPMTWLKRDWTSACRHSRTWCPKNFASYQPPSTGWQITSRAIVKP